MTMTENNDSDELNRRLHEIMGLCFHVRTTNQCIKCHKILIKAVGRGEYECLPANINFLTWEGFGILWEWLQKHKKFQNFLWEQDGDNCCLQINLINPRALAEAVAEFFKEET